MIFLYSLIIFGLMFALGALAYSYRKSHAGNVGDHLLDDEPYEERPHKTESPEDITYKRPDNKTDHPERH